MSNFDDVVSFEPLSKRAIVHDIEAIKTTERFNELFDWICEKAGKGEPHEIEKVYWKLPKEFCSALELKAEALLSSSNRPSFFAFRDEGSIDGFFSYGRTSHCLNMYFKETRWIDSSARETSFSSKNESSDSASDSSSISSTAVVSPSSSSSSSSSRQSLPADSIHIEEFRLFSADFEEKERAREQEKLEL